MAFQGQHPFVNPKPRPPIKKLTWEPTKPTKSRIATSGVKNEQMRKRGWKESKREQIE